MATELQKRISNGKMILISEIKPPKTGDPGPIRVIAEKYAGNVCALGISDNRDGICMSALAAASIVAGTGVEPVMHMVTRDKNRIALVSDYLGAQSMGIQNLLVTSGTHQTLNTFRKAKNVFDIDSIQLIQILNNLDSDGSIIGEVKIKGIKPACIGATADPFADPLEMQIIKLEKKITAGAQFIITKPVFHIDRFKEWWEKVIAHNIHKKAAIIAGISILTDAGIVQILLNHRPDPLIPESLVQRICSKKDKNSQREEGIEMALETIEILSSLEGIHGFEMSSDDDHEAVLKVIEDQQQNLLKKE